MYKTFRPKLYLPKNYIAKLADTFGIALILCSIGFIIINWSALPNEVPTHFNFEGVADGWGSKYQMLLLPVISIVIYIMMEVIERKPHTHNYPDRLNEKNVANFYKVSQQLVNYTKNISMLLFTYISVRSVLMALGKAEGLSIIPFFSIVALLLIILVICIVKMKKIT
ncbi:DUF1648 domain-containing protein [Lysinibacillus sp. 54212]|uniref:DUF1648 domain-containing protein n=1 Tax=Lysinibacillus sp. 54212 TaxID=3119829 RepID=UPI002FCA081A